ncbi:hypothetical protein [Pseudarthrobacter sulfonivorans]|uniref:hypothetical protein n=1 Tax=Pseudarthrobacter sulfonivorans TaxID=121292 RepID=UPI00285750C8|nr:hypothetical protein [Pseudarthrobacter sulfonivorans]MDR6413536.1 hypothetical protein [Pseudarthrobacter sulfonivorans]
MVLLWPFLLASGVYLLLRWVIRAPGGGTSAVTVSQHALWIGVIGWLASSLQSAGTAGILPAGSSSAVLSTPASILGALAWPILGCMAVHAIGQLSYPGPQFPRRSATLEVRRIRDFLPRGLAWTVVAIFAGSALLIGFIASLPRYDSIPYSTQQVGSDGFHRVGGDGRIPGWVLAACLGTAWLALALGTALVLMLISRRRQLEALDAAENDLLRTIAMNRLLRTVATIAAGLAAVAGNFAARPDPAANATGGWTNPAGLAALVVLVTMWWWAPPKLSGTHAGGNGPRLAEPPAAAHPATRLSVSLGAAMGIAPVVVAVLGIFAVGFFLPGAGSSGQAVVFVALMATAVLLVAGAGELLLQRNYGSHEVPRTRPRQVVSPALLTTGIIAAALYLAITVVAAVGEWKLREAGFVVLLPSDGVQGGVLLMTASAAWPPALDLPAEFWTATWQPALTAGALLVATGVAIAVIPVRGFARVPASPAGSVPEAAR